MKLPLHRAHAWLLPVFALLPATAHALSYTVTDLGTLSGGSGSQATGINANGDVAGFADTAGGAASHAFRYSGRTMTDLGTLGGSGNQAYGINANGDVVGFSSTADPGVHTFLSSGGFMLDLNDHVPADPAWVLREARAINDAGQIVGSGSIGGQTHAFLLTPMAVPEPSGYAIVTGVALLGYVAWRRRPAR